MDWLANILTSQNAVVVILGVVAILIVLAFLVKKGIFSFNGKGLKVGIKDNERSIIRSQLEYMNTVVDGMVQYLPMNDLDYYRTKYVLSKIKDSLEQIIIFNHIRSDDEYIQLKQEVIYALVRKLTDKDFFKTDEFKKQCDDMTEKLIKRFVKIRESMEG